MDNITIPVDDVVKHGLTINEYLLLYNVATNGSISGLIDNTFPALTGLEQKGF